MKARILLLAAGIATLTSCTSLYKTSQTPDDVYFSPARPAPPAGDDYVQNDNSRNGTQSYQSYQAYQDAYRNDRFLRMSIGNPYYLSVYDDYSGFDWRYNAYAYYGSSPWNNYYAWNNYYNPYCVMPIGGYGGYYTKGSYIPTVISKPVAFNGASYGGSGGSSPRYISNSNGSYYNSGSQPRYSNSNSSYTPANNNSSNSNNNNYHSNETYTPTRSYSPPPSSSSSSGSSGGGGGGGGISRPTRP